MLFIFALILMTSLMPCDQSAAMLAVCLGLPVDLINHNQTSVITSIFFVNYAEGQKLHSV